MEVWQGSNSIDVTSELTNVSANNVENGMSFNVSFGRVERGGEENFEDDIIYSNEASSTIKGIMKRLLKIRKHIKGLKEKLGVQTGDSIPRVQSALGDTVNDDEKIAGSLQKYGDLELFLWCRLAKIILDEQSRCTDAYASTMNLQDRLPFESLVEVIYHNTPFCDYMGEIVNATVERDEPHENAQRDSVRRVLRLYRRVMERTQVVATYTGLLVVEGSRESFLDPLTIQDICKTIVEEKKRRKRLIAQSLAFSMLEEDDQAIAEALSQQLPHVLLQRLRHLVHRIFGPPRNNLLSPLQRFKCSPFRHYSSVIESDSNSLRTSRKTSPDIVAEGNEDMVGTDRVRLTLTPAARTARHLYSQAGDGDGVSVTAIMHNSETVVEKGVPKDVRVERFQDGVYAEDSRPCKKRRIENGEEAVYSQKLVECWEPRRGDKVSRGPMWSFGDQGKRCDFAEVVEVASTDEVVVRWVTSVDFAPRDNERCRFFRYKYKEPYEQVICWDHYLEIETVMPENVDFKMEELMSCCAIVGSLCHQREAVLPALQFQSVESMFYVLTRIDLDDSAAAVEAEESRLTSSTLSGVGYRVIPSDRDSLEVRFRWDGALQAAKRRYRRERELVGRVCWVLNSLFFHKKLALIFLELGGLRQLMRLISGRRDTVTTYGCCMVLSQLAKAAVFEILLRNHGEYFEPILKFVLHQWKTASSHDVQGSAGGFFFLALSFPCVVNFFDAHQGPQVTLNTIERLLKTSVEEFDIFCPGVTLPALKCTYIYLVSHLMLATRVVFRKHRLLSVLATDSAPERSLPRDAATVESVLGYLAAPSASIPDISTETVQSLLTRERLAAFRFFADNNFHQVVLRCAQFYFTQSRWDLLAASLNVLCVLVVVPFFRPLVADAQYPESGVAHLIMIVSELTSTFQSGNASRESHLIPCVATSLQILLNLTRPPADKNDEACAATFNRVCGIIRANDGVRTLLEVLKVRKDPVMSVKLQLFPVVARALQLMVTLRRYADTHALFDALGVGAVARDLMTYYGDVQKEYISMMGPRYVGSEVHAAGRFMANIKCFLFDETDGKTPAVSMNPVELEQRQSIISRSHISYSRESLLELICRHLEADGLPGAASVLRRDAHLPCDSSPPQHLANPSLEMTLSPIGAPTLDGIVRSYLRQQHERCTNPITTLPQFDLRKGHVYYPMDAPVDQMRNAFNRRLAQKMGLDFSLRTEANENHFTYRYPCYLFDITGSGDELRGDSVAFCDDGETLIVGTSEGGVALFDTFPDDSADNKLIEQHLAFDNSGVVAVCVSNDNTLLGLVSAEHDIAVMSRSELPVVRYQVSESRAAMFSRCNAYLLATCDEEHTCRLYDLEAQCEIRRFSDPSWVDANIDNVATFDCFSQLVLSDAVLWDVRCADKPIRRFDRFTDSFCNIFHPFSPLVVIDEKVWDLRTLSILQTVPSFGNTRSFHVNPFGRVIYSFREASALIHTPTPAISVVESHTFETVFSTEVRPGFRAFAIEPSDRYCAAILSGDASAVVRVFSTSSGLLPGQQAFSLPQNSRGEGSDATLESDDDEEAENDSSWSGSFDDDDDDDDGDDRGFHSEWGSDDSTQDDTGEVGVVHATTVSESGSADSGDESWATSAEETTESQDGSESGGGTNNSDETLCEST